MSTRDAVQRLKGMADILPNGPKSDRELDVALNAIADVFLSDDSDAVVKAWIEGLTQDESDELGVLATGTVVVITDAIFAMKPALALAAMLYFGGRAATLKAGKHV